MVVERERIKDKQLPANTCSHLKKKEKDEKKGPAARQQLLVLQVL